MICNELREGVLGYNRWVQASLEERPLRTLGYIGMFLLWWVAAFVADLMERE